MFNIDNKEYCRISMKDLSIEDIRNILEKCDDFGHALDVAKNHSIKAETHAHTMVALYGKGYYNAKKTKRKRT